MAVHFQACETTERPRSTFAAVPFADRYANHAALGTPFRNAQGETVAEAFDRQAQEYLKQPGHVSFWYTFTPGIDPLEERQACLCILDAPSGEAALEMCNDCMSSPLWQTMHVHSVAMFPGQDRKASLTLHYTPKAARASASRFAMQVRFDDIDAIVQAGTPVSLEQLQEGKWLAEKLGLGAVQRYNARIERVLHAQR
jgi:hypothetical protein